MLITGWNQYSEERKEGTPIRVPISQAKAAELMNTSVRSIQRATAVKDADPELAEKVAQGKFTVTAAEKMIKPHVAQNSGDNEWYTHNVDRTGTETQGILSLRPPVRCRIAAKGVSSRALPTSIILLFLDLLGSKNHVASPILDTGIRR